MHRLIWGFAGRTYHIIGNLMSRLKLDLTKTLPLERVASVPNVHISVFFCRVPWLYQYWLFMVLCPGTSEGSTGSGSGFKASQKTGQRLKVSSDRLGEAGNRTCDPWFTRHRFIPYTTAATLFHVSNKR